MHWGKRGPGSTTGRRRGAFLPWQERLENRRLLTGTLDLATTETTPYGVEMLGTANSNAGYTVTDVGDVTKSVGGGYDAYVIGQPGVSTPSTTLATTFTGNTAYLVVGSNSVGTSTAVPYNSLSNVPLTQDNQRAGDLGQLGQFGELQNPSYQVNPTVTQPTAPTAPYKGYNYNGLTFTTNSANSGLGFSVAALGDIDGSGYQSFAIGAPGTNTVYIIYGSASLATLVDANTATNKVINLDTNALASAGVKEVVLQGGGVAGAAGGEFGYSVGGLGNFFNYGVSAPDDIAIGVPGAAAPSAVVDNGTTIPAGTVLGGVFAISGLKLEGLSSSPTPVPAATLAADSIEYLGTGSASEVGASVSTAGDFDGYRANNVSTNIVDDLLVGAPGSNQSYIVYGYQQYAKSSTGISDSMIGTVQFLGQIGTQATVSPSYLPLEGVILSGNVDSPGASDSGFSVSPAGDFNGDGLDDVIVGAPGGTQSSATIYYGIPTYTPKVTNPLTPIHYTGMYGAEAASANMPLISAPLVLQDTVNAGSEVGYSVSYVGDITGEGIPGVLIGAPMTNGGKGAAYIVPGNYETPSQGLTSPVTLATAISNLTYAATAFQVTNSFGNSLAYLGTSVSGRSPLIPSSGTNAQQYTLDQDAIPDVFIGAPGFNSADPATSNTTLGRMNAGIAFALEGSLLPLSTPDNVILTGAGVNSDVPNGSYTLTTNGAATFYIFSAAATSTTAAFDPATDLTSPITLVINGVTFTGVTFTVGKDSTGADDIQFNLTAAQVQQLGLTASTTPITITIRGTTNAGTVFLAKASATVTSGGGGGGGGGGVGSSTPTAASILAAPIYTGVLGGQEFPSITTLNTLSSYQPIPIQLAYQQFLPSPGFLARQEVAVHPSKKKGAHQTAAGTQLNISAIAHSESPYLKYNTLTQKVRDRGKIPLGKTVKFTHKVKVVPTTAQTATFVG